MLWCLTLGVLLTVIVPILSRWWIYCKGMKRPRTRVALLTPDVRSKGRCYGAGYTKVAPGELIEGKGSQRGIGNRRSKYKVAEIHHKIYP